MTSTLARRLGRLEASAPATVPAFHVLRSGDPEPATVRLADFIFELVLVNPPAREQAP